EPGACRRQHPVGSGSVCVVGFFSLILPPASTPSSLLPAARSPPSPPLAACGHDGNPNRLEISSRRKWPALCPTHRVPGGRRSTGERIDFAREVGYSSRQLFTC